MPLTFVSNEPPNIGFAGSPQRALSTSRWSCETDSSAYWSRFNEKLCTRFTNYSVSCVTRIISNGEWSEPPAILELNSLEDEGETVNLDRTLRVQVTRGGDSWTFESPELEILSSGTSLAQAVGSFSDDFFVHWNVITKTEDDGLSKEARLIKGRLLSYLDSK